MKVFCLCISLIFALTWESAFGQEYSIRDRAEITYKAQLVLQEFEALLNAVSNVNITQSETGELIRNSYSSSTNKIFRSESVVVEDDINPEHFGASTRQDKRIRKYLEDFDLLYSKSDEPSVHFTNYQVSNLKQADSLYIKVLFDSQYQNKHKGKATGYKKTQRLAYIRAEKAGKQWLTQIVSIVFYDPATPITDTAGDVAIDESLAGDLSIRASGDSTAYTGITVEMLVKEETKRLFDQYVARRDSAFAASIAQGDKALLGKQWDAAITAYTEAQNINPYDITPKLKLNRVTRAILDEQNSNQRSFDQALLNAERANAVRDYATAKNYYQEALLLKPNEQALRNRVGELDGIIRNKSLLESKYVAGQYDEAIKDYSKAIKDDRNNPDYYFGRGRCYYKQANTKKALADYSKAIELDGNYIEALDTRAALYVQLQDYHKAVADLSIIISNQSFSEAYLPKRAEVKVLLNDVAGALADYAEAIKLVPAVASNYFEKGLLHYRQHEHELALASFDEVIRLEPLNAAAQYHRGMVFNSQGKVKQASSDFNEALNKGLEKPLAEKINQLANHYYSQGIMAQNNNNHEEAITNLINALIIRPTFVDAWLKKGNTFFIMGDYETAITNYDMAIKYDSVSFAVFKRAESNFNVKQFRLAAEDFDAYTRIEPSKFETHLLLGKSLNELQHYDQAVKALQQGIKLKEDNPEVHFQLGRALYQLKSYKTALEALDTSIKKNKDFAVAYFLRGAAQHELKDYKKAIKDVAKSVELGYKNSQSYFALGNAYRLNGDESEAIKEYTRAVRHDSLFTDALKQRAACLKKSKLYVQAYKDYERIVLLDTSAVTNSTFLTNKGLVELYLNQIPQAEASFDKALQVGSAGGWALYGKACVLAKQNNLDGAFSWFEKAFQTKEISWDEIKKDELIAAVAKNKKFKSLVKKHL